MKLFVHNFKSNKNELLAKQSLIVNEKFFMQFLNHS